ncbi:MAG: hypothetical protein QM767_27780 [Anaeromyxobacter sp.]
MVLPLLTALALAAQTPTAAVLHVEDDYPRALAEARQRQLPLLVEVWAPW